MAGQYSSTSTTRSDLERILFDETAEPKALPLSLLREITGGFSAEHKIGSGGFATVYKGKLGNGTVAVKNWVHQTHLHEKEFTREVECLMRARHKNVVRFLGYCSDTQGAMVKHEGKLVMAKNLRRLLCFEYAPKGNLHEYIKDASCGPDWTNRYRIIRGIVEGLHHLHQNNIVHLDLKPANILLDDNMVPKIADFGLSRCFDGQESKITATQIGGTSGYMPPELDSGVIRRENDVFSLGAIIIETLTGKKSSHVVPVESILESWRNWLPPGNTQFDQVKVCAEIGTKCCEPNPLERPTTQQIIDRLDKTENVDGSMKIDLTRSSNLQGETASGELHHGTLPILQEKSSKDENGRRRPSNNAELTEDTELLAAHLGELAVEIDSAFRSSEENEVYIFMKGKYVLMNYAPGSINDRIIHGPQFIGSGFKSLVGTVFEVYGIDASFGSHVKNEAIIFSGNICARINFAPRTIDDKIIGGKKTITEMFPFFKGTNFENGIDAAFESTLIGEAYLFKGSEYARINYAKPAYLTIGRIADGFECLSNTEFERDIGAAFASHRPNQAYLFKGNRYIQLYFTPAKRKDRILGGGSPKEIVPSNWPSLTNILLRKNQ